MQHSCEELRCGEEDTIDNMNRFALAQFLCMTSLLWIDGLSTVRAQPAHHCATMTVDSAMRSAHPEIGTKEEFEQWIQRMIRQDAQYPTRNGEILTIPVIIHVVHDGESVGNGSNLSENRILSQLDVLNEDFRRLLNSPGYNTYFAGADTEIEFCLATVDPDGMSLAEPGIHRINRNQAGFTSPPYSPNGVRSSIMPATYWDPDRYMNIWVAELQNDILGFAQLPSQSTLVDLPNNNGPATTDGVVIDPDNFGRGLGAASPYDRGRTTTHEIGHWLGLRHIWGDGDCDDDDYCADTPNAENPNYGCPNDPVSCGSADLFENYMDYTDDACMNVFTQCQKERMRIVLTNAIRRASLLDSYVCQGVRFSVGKSRLCAGESIGFSDESLYNPTSWQWSFPGGIPATSTNENPTVQYPSAGMFDVSLTVTNDQGTETFTFIDYIQVESSGGVLFAEDFEQGLTGWQVQNPDNTFGWELKGVSGNGGNQAPYVNLFLYTTVGARDGLISPKIDLSNYSDLTLAFEHAYRPFSSPTDSRDSLVVYASVNDGQSFPYVLYRGGNGSAFRTGPNANGDFVPAQASDWCGSGQGVNCISIGPGPLAPLAGQPDVRFRFETVNGFGNNIYIDNISLSGGCDLSFTNIDSPVEATPTWEVYPNPATDLLTISWSEQVDAPITLRLVDFTGRVVLAQTVIPTTDQRIQLAIDHVSPGGYVLQLGQDGMAPFMQKVIISR